MLARHTAGPSPWVTGPCRKESGPASASVPASTEGDRKHNHRPQTTEARRMAGTIRDVVIPERTMEARLRFCEPATKRVARLHGQMLRKGVPDVGMRRRAQLHGAPSAQQRTPGQDRCSREHVANDRVQNRMVDALDIPAQRSKGNSSVSTMKLRCDAMGIDQRVHHVAEGSWVSAMALISAARLSLACASRSAKNGRFVWKILIQRADVDPRTLGNAVGGEAAPAVFYQNVSRCLQNRRNGLF